MHIQNRQSRWLLFTLLVLLPALGLCGCTRPFFRKRADQDVDILLKQKDVYPTWKIDQLHVYPDPRARFADPTNPDKPPMPPDDPAARDLSPNPQRPGKAGVGYVEGMGYLDLLAAWDAQNRQELEAERAAGKLDRQPGEEVPNQTGDVREGDSASAKRIESMQSGAQYELASPVTIDRTLPPPEKSSLEGQVRPYFLKLEQAVELAFVNSREYQTQCENLYLAALPLTQERFAFSTQWYAFGQLFRERFGRDTPEGQTNRWRTNGVMGFGKLFSTGALLLVRFANETVYNIGGMTPGVVSESALSLDIVQPLLRGGGRAVTLEPLTQAERNLLYSIRDFARFRQQFFVFIAAGPGIGAAGEIPSLSPGTIGSPGVFIPGAVPPPFIVGGNPILPDVPPGTGERLPPLRSPGAGAQGYMATVLQKAVVVNQYDNIRALENYLRLFRVYLEGGIVNAVQVGQIEQNLLRSVENVLTSQASYRDSLDQFKLQLGLPTALPLELDEGPLRPMFAQTRRFEAITKDFEAAVNQGLQYNRPGESARLRGRLRELFTASKLVAGTRFRESILERWAAWERMGRGVGPGGKTELDRKLDQLRDERRKLLDLREAREERDLTEPEEARLNALEDEIDLGRFERSLRLYESRPWLLAADAARRQLQESALFQEVYRGALTMLEDAFAERMEQVQKSWPALPPLCVDGVDLLSADEDRAVTIVAQTALTNRFDLMNQRAELVDSWRKIAVAANSLLGTLNVEYHYDTATPRGQARPLAFGGSRNRHRLTLNGELPLVRIIERNDYRSALIAYQQQRRQLMLAEDQVLFAVRLELRQLRAIANSYHRVQKRAVELAYIQVDQALQAFSQPQSPSGPAPVGVGAPTGGGGGGGGDPAALTQQLLNAQNALLNAQNTLYNTWINYAATRMDLYRDLGLMQLDARGVWIDEASCTCNPSTVPGSDSDGQPPGGTGDGQAPDQLPEPRPLPPAAPAPLGMVR